MNDAPIIADEDLMAYVDGELAADRRADVEAFLARSPAAAERVEQWRQQAKALRAAFSRLDAEPAPPAVVAPFRKRAAAQPHLRLCPEGGGSGAKAEGGAPGSGKFGAAPLGLAFFLGAVIALAAAIASGRLHFSEAPAPQASANVKASSPEVAMAQRAVAALAGFAAGEFRAAAETHKGRRVIAPDLSAVGYTLVGGGAAPSAPADADDLFCLFYARQGEPPAALCAGRDDGHGPDAAYWRDPGGIETASWRQAGSHYILAADLPKTSLRSLKDKIGAGIAAF